MGYTGAAGFAEAESRGEIDLRIALVWHLTSNHYPPLPEALVEPCWWAIQYARRGEWDETILLDETGIKVRDALGDFTSRPTASRLVDICHLEAFVAIHDGYSIDDEEF